MTYAQFHMLFTLPLLALVLILNRKNPGSFSKKSLLGTLSLVLLAMVYTTPWDSYLIKEQIWTYAPGNVLFTIYRIPIEEYFFFFIQTIIGCLFTSYLLHRFTERKQWPMELGPTHFLRLATGLALLCLLFFFSSGEPRFRYLNLVFFWALPILVLQWSLGASHLRKFWKPLLMGVGLLSLYFWFADSYAIEKEIWSFPETSISGWRITKNLPLEEALFFLVTNIMVVQGYILFTQTDFQRSRIGRKTTRA